MQVRKIRNDGSLAAAAFANNGAAGWFGGCAKAVEALLNTPNCGREQWILDQYPLGTVHHFMLPPQRTRPFPHSQ
jgi:hypothetical protein